MCRRIDQTREKSYIVLFAFDRASRCGCGRLRPSKTPSNLPMRETPSHIVSRLRHSELPSVKTRKGRFLWHFRQIHLPSHPCTLRSDTTCPVNCRSRDHLECVDAIRQTQFWKTWNGALLTIISNVDGNTALSEDWTRYTRFEILQRRPPQGHVGAWKSHQMPTRPGQIPYPSEPSCLKNKGRKRKPNTDAAPNFKASSTLTQKTKSVKTLLDTSRGNWKDQHLQ